MPETLIDPYGRKVTSLRISITQACNFKCFFCHNEGDHNSGPEMTVDEIAEITKISSQLGIKKIKITGGEPLLRKDLSEIIRSISPHVEEVSMVTNASLLAPIACELKEAGLSRVNISCHSTHPEIFKEITVNGNDDNVEKGIKAALECGLTPVKLNMVVMKGVNSDEIQDMILFAKKMEVILQLIEFQALEKGEKFYNDLHYDLRPVEKMLKERSKKVTIREMHRRKKYFLKNGGQVEVVRPMHNTEFCANCSRLRLTSDGKLKPCLMRDDNHVELVTLLRQGATQEEIVNAFKESVKQREPFWSI